MTRATPPHLPLRAWRALAVALALVATVHALLLGPWSPAGARRALARTSAAVHVRQVEPTPAPSARAPAPVLTNIDRVPALVRVSTRTLPPLPRARPVPAHRPATSAGRPPREATREAPVEAPRPAEDDRLATPAATPALTEPLRPAMLAAADTEPEPREVQTAVVTARPGKPADASAAPVDPPLYATRAPAAQVLHYRVSRGMLSGSGELSWQPESGGWRLALRAGLPMIPVLLEQTSEGRFDPRGLAPLRHTDRRWRRSERAITFDRATDGTPGVIRYSVAEAPRSLVAGTQDRVSWIVQLASIVRAWPGGVPRAGSQIEIWVAAVAGDLQHWVLRVEAPDSSGDTAGLLRLVREAREPHETRADVWLDARLQYLPRRLRLSDAGSDPLELVSTDGN